MPFQIQSAATPKWVASDNVGCVHIFSASGETREVDDQYAETPGEKKNIKHMEFIAVVEPDGEVTVYSDCVIWQATLNRALHSRGVYLATLEKSGQAYRLTDLEPGTQRDALMDWLAANCREVEGAAELTEAAAQSHAAPSPGPTAEAPF